MKLGLIASGRSAAADGKISFTNGAVRSFVGIFSPRMGLREARRALVALSLRTRTILKADSPNGTTYLLPDGAKVMLSIHEWPGWPFPVCDNVLPYVECDDDEDWDGMFTECRRSA